MFVFTLLSAANGCWGVDAGSYTFLWNAANAPGFDLERRTERETSAVDACRWKFKLSRMDDL